MDQNMPLIYYPYTYRPVSINSIHSNENSVLAFPNPCTKTLFVKYSIQNPGNVKIILSSLQGVPVQQDVISLASAGEYLQVFQVEHIPNGMYLITVMQDENVIFSQQVIKK